MTLYEANPLLKQAITGYVSGVAYHHRSFILRQMFATMARQRMEKMFLILSGLSVKLQGRHTQALLEIASNEQFVKDFMELLSAEPLTQAQRIEAIFNEFGIDVSFLAELDISIADFSNFIIDLHAVAKQKHEAGEMPSDAEEQKVFLVEQATILVRTKYVHFINVLFYMDRVVDSIGGFARLERVAVRLQAVVVAEVVTQRRVSSDDLAAFAPQSDTNQVVAVDAHTPRMQQQVNISNPGSEIFMSSTISLKPESSEASSETSLVLAEKDVDVVKSIRARLAFMFSE
jgi:hypothetical protein